MNRELQLINSVLDTKAIGILFQGRAEELFLAYKDVWDFLKEYYQKYQTVPAKTIVVDRFADFEEVSVDGDPKYYLDLLRAEYTNNRMDALLRKAASSMKETSGTETLTRLSAELSKLSAMTSQSKDTNIMDFEEAERHYREVRERAEAKGGVPGIPTGISFIDGVVTTGFQGGDFITFIGYPARGKSALSTLIAANAYENGYNVMIVSLEMNEASVRDRIYTVLGSGLFDSSDLALGSMQPDDFRGFTEKHADRKNKITVITAEGVLEGITPNFIQSKMDEHQPDLVILDYAQLAFDNKLSGDLTTRMTNLSTELRMLALQKDKPVIAICSATPDNAANIKGPPNIEQISWAKRFAYDSTLSIAIHRHDDSNIYEIVAVKSRSSALFAGYLDWDMGTGKIEEKFDFEPSI